MELLIFSHELTPDSLERFNEIKSAMKDLISLISDRQELTWAQRWLADLGYDIYNPVDLFALSLYWGNHLASLSEYLQTLHTEFS